MGEDSHRLHLPWGDRRALQALGMALRRVTSSCPVEPSTSPAQCSSPSPPHAHCLFSLKNCCIPARVPSCSFPPKLQLPLGKACCGAGAFLYRSMHRLLLLGHSTLPLPHPGPCAGHLLEGGKALQRDRDRLDPWAEQQPSAGSCSWVTTTPRSATGWRSALQAERDLGVFVSGRLSPEMDHAQTSTGGKLGSFIGLRNIHGQAEAGSMMS